MCQSWRLVPGAAKTSGAGIIFAVQYGRNGCILGLHHETVHFLGSGSGHDVRASGTDGGTRAWSQAGDKACAQKRDSVRPSVSRTSTYSGACQALSGCVSTGDEQPGQK